jgi:subtilisin-like proprotein convertase family protein
MAKTTLSDLFKRWMNRGRRVSREALPTRYRARLRLEEVEQRLTPTTLPPVTVSDTRTIDGGFAPQAVADPNNPNTIVLVSASRATPAFPFGAALSGQLSRDGGQTWSSFTIANPDTGIQAGPGGSQLTTVNSPSVAMSRTGEIYVAWTSTTADFTTAGRLRVASFTLGSSGLPAVLNPSVVLYQWLGQDPVYNPTVAVDNNVDQFTDPDTNIATPQDTMLGATGSGKAVYVAWNTKAGTPTVGAGHSFVNNSQFFTPTAIFTAASRDMGATWTTPVPVNNGGFVVPPPPPGQLPGGGIAPQIFFTPGDLNPTTNDSGGRLQFIWSTAGRTLPFPSGDTVMDVSQPDSGVLDNEAATVYNSPSGPFTVISEPIIDPNGGPDIPIASDSKLTVNITTDPAGNAPFFTTLADLDITVAITEPHDSQLSLDLIPPASTGIGTIHLLLSRVDGKNATIPNPGGTSFGLPDVPNLGVNVVNNIPFQTGTVFDSQAARLIYDPANSAPYIAHFRPEVTSLSILDGVSAANLNGVWTLRASDSFDDDRKAGNDKEQEINSWSMKMSSLISNSGFGADQNITGAATPFIQGTGANLGGLGATNATALGYGAGIAVAYDNSLGAFSPFSGRMYIAYTASNGDIFVNSSDDQGQTWKHDFSDEVQVNDDSPDDNFTEGNRHQFMPSITVDPVTGTVVVMWYDARLDASDARVTTYMATSIDGGDTFSPQGLTGFLNSTKDAQDQLTRTTVQLEAMPANLRAAGVFNGGSEAGLRQSVLAYGGQIKPFWTGNENAFASNIYTSTVITAAGPRVIDNDTSHNTDQGAVTADAPGGYNNTFAADGTRQINGFTVTFDRVIDVSTFTPADVSVLFRAPTTKRDDSVPPTQIPVSAVVPLDNNTVQAGFPDDATRFFVQFATPQTAVGTYSYSVGPRISDRIRSVRTPTFTPPDTPAPIADLSTTESTISVPALAGNPTVQHVQVGVDITHPFDSDLRITLFGPDPDGPGPLLAPSVILSNQNGGNFGQDYSGTIFDDSAIVAIDAGSPFATPPFTGTFKPQTTDPVTGQPLANNTLATFNGIPMSGQWTLRVEDLKGNDSGTLNGWSLTFLDSLGNPITVQQNGDFLDQDADSRTQEIATNSDTLTSTSPKLFTDAYSAPGTIGAGATANPFDLSFNPNTLPLIEPGPHLVSSFVPSNPTATDNLVLNGTANELDLVFDRDIDPNSFTPANILLMTGPAGPVTEEQDLTVLGTKGTFHVTFSGGTGPQTTVDLPFNVAAAGGTTADSSLQNALAALPNIGVGNVTVASTAVAGGRTYRITFTGTLGSANQPAITAAGAAGATTSVTTERFTVTPIASSLGVDGGYRSFAIGFPTQQLSGSYNIEFGPNQALSPSDPLYSIRSVNVPQLVALITPASSNPNTLTVTFDQAVAGGLTLADILRVTGPSGDVSLTGVTITQISATKYQISFPAALSSGQYVVDFKADPVSRPLYVASSGSAIDSNFNAGLDVLRGQNPSASAFASSTYASTGSAEIKPATDDGSGNLQPTVTDLSINVTDDFIISSDTIQNIELLMNISHPNVRDLDIDLIPPTDTGIDSIRLFTGSLLAASASNQTANFTNTRFLDRVNDPNVPSIETAHPPFNAGASNFFSPQTPLNVLLGKPARGEWTLRVTNHGTNPYPPPGFQPDPNFNPSAPIQIINWSLTLPHSVPGTGLGESVADRFQASFRIFTQDPTNSLTQTTWTPVGPAPTNETANSARISAIAVDPSDPTGNTVYLGVAGGGIWKTTDFLTSTTVIENGGTVPSGPHYVPLTDFGNTNAVNISSIALFPRNNDPNQTIVFALTGESNTFTRFPGQYAAAGVGVIRSMDGGKTWQVLDSSTNVDSSGNIVKIADPIRDHLFVGATGYKIVVDPNRGKDGGVILYMALSGNANQNGLWRSLDGGNSWFRIQAGNATDVVLAAGSANTNDPLTGATVFQGNLQQLYAAFSTTPLASGPGVYRTDSAPAAASLNLMMGGSQNPLLLDIGVNNHITTLQPASNPNQGGRRITLAVPALTGNALEDSYLRDWLYAMTRDPSGATQLYLTKDAGAHWTLVRVPNNQQFFTPPINGTNDESTTVQNPLTAPTPRAQVNVGTNNDYDMALAVDPSNPNIVYMGGFSTNSIRLDLTKMRDAHNWTFYNNSDEIDPPNASNPAFTTEINSNSLSIGGLHPQIFIPAGQVTGTPEHGVVLQGGTFNLYEDANGNPIDFLNLLRDYNQPFATNSLIRVFNTDNEPQSPLAGFYVNDGADISWSPFDDILDPNVPDQTGSNETENRLSGFDIHAITSFTDPVTGKTRLVFGTDNGVFTGVDSRVTTGTGPLFSPTGVTITDGIGFSQAVHGNRNGNLQVSQFYSGAVQPSQFAADLAGALFYGMGDESGFPVSSPDALTTGNLNWRGPIGDGVSVVVDEAGSGTAFEYRSPFNSGSDQNTTATSQDFFRVMAPATNQAFSGGVSRTGSASGSLFDFGDFWPGTNAAQGPVPIPQPTANPVNPNVLMIGSLAGRVFRSTNQGSTWVAEAQPLDLDGASVISVAFGASDPTKPTLTNNFLYAGTTAGDIFSTTTGGAPWIKIGSFANGLDGSKVLRIEPDPKVGSKDVFAITTTGVFYKADGTTAAGNWSNITGNLFSIKRSTFGDAADPAPALVPASLSALAVDWRFAFPSPTTPGLTFPILYVAGNGGVFRSVDFGTDWTFFPDMADNGAPVEGGYLPNTHITDLDLSIGDLDPSTGTYKAGGLNMLVATTYGRGMYAIRLSDTLQPGSFISGPQVTKLINPNPIGGPSRELDVQFSGPVDPSTFSPADVQLLGPGGVPITVTGVNLLSTASPVINPRNLYAITFSPQTTSGLYSITIGYDPLGGDVPEIADPSGFLMNQNGNTVNGEPIVDQYHDTITLNTATNSHLVVTSSPSSITAGIAGHVVIQVHDANDALLTVNGTLTLAPAPGTGTFSPTTATVTNGVATFDITYQTAGPQTVNAAFNGPPTINGTSWTTTVIAAAASQLAITPSSIVLTSPATQTFTVTAEDAFGNAVTTYNQTATLTTTGAAATVPGSVDLVNGAGSFDASFNASGTVQITAAGPDPNNASNQFTGTATVSVNPASATHLGFTISATTFTVGDTGTVTVRALDAQNNLANNLDGTALTLAFAPTSTNAATPASPVFVNGVATFTVQFTSAGSFTITAATNPPPAPQLSVSIGPIVVGAVPPPPPATDRLTGIFAVGTGVDGSPVINVFNGDGSVKTSFIPFPPGFNNEVDPNSGGFTGGQRVAVGDVTGDGVPDYVIGTGPTITATVEVFSGATGQKVLTYFPFDNFTGGVFVAVGDVTGDGVNDIAITPDEGGGPRVVVLRGGNFARIANFMGIDDPNFRGGARAAIGDMNGDGFGELVISAGFGGGPRISIFDGAALANGINSHPIGDFFLFEPALRNGAYVAVGDVNGDGFGDLIGGAGPGGGPRVLTVSGKTLLQQGPELALDAPIANFFGGDSNNRGGIRVAAKNIDGDADADVLVGVGEGGGDSATMYRGSDLVSNVVNPVYQLDVLPGYSGGVYVG